MSAPPLFRDGESLACALGVRMGPLLIVDVGAAEYEGGAPPPYAPLLQSPMAALVGFDPNRQEADAARNANRVVLPHAIADGGEHEFRFCAAAMTSSLLEPNTAWLGRFENLAELCRVIRRERIRTMRLDDLPETAGCDFLKIDVQGATLLVLEGAQQVLSRTLVVHSELEFGPIYQTAPKFGDVERFLSVHGFEFHHFVDFGKRRVLSGESAFGRTAVRQLWGDGVFVPSFARFDALSPQCLMKLAAIVHDCYGAQDLAHACLMRADALVGGDLAPAYRVACMGSATERRP